MFYKRQHACTDIMVIIHYDILMYHDVIGKKDHVILRVALMFLLNNLRRKHNGDNVLSSNMFTLFCSNK